MISPLLTLRKIICCLPKASLRFAVLRLFTFWMVSSTKSRIFFSFLPFVFCWLTYLVLLSLFHLFVCFGSFLSYMNVASCSSHSPICRSTAFFSFLPFVFCWLTYLVLLSLFHLFVFSLKNIRTQVSAGGPNCRWAYTRQNPPKSNPDSPCGSPT